MEPAYLAKGIAQAPQQIQAERPVPWSSILQTKPLLNDAVLIVLSGEASATGVICAGRVP